jgi:hypothetical protein
MISKIIQTQPYFFKKILTYYDINCWGDQQLKVSGFQHYNWLIDINACFSDYPTGDIIDRTCTIQQPWLVHVQRPWKKPISTLTLNQCFEQRVQELCQQSQQINLFYSGGIDSTAMAIAFLKHCKNFEQLRIIYTPSSLKENPAFFFLLQNTSGLQMVDFSGDYYLEQNLDGNFVTADGADDFTASMDQSFYENIGYQALFERWQNFFFNQTKNIDLVDWCENVFFADRGLEIQNLLQARWFFYTACKLQKFPLNLFGLLQPNQSPPVAFFHCDYFESWFAHNTEKIFPRPDYRSYKQPLKDYIFEFDQNKTYFNNKTKYNSSQLTSYRNKKIMLQNLQYIMLLSDHRRISWSNLPLMSKKEYLQNYGNTLDYLFAPCMQNSTSTTG